MFCAACMCSGVTDVKTCIVFTCVDGKVTEHACPVHAYCYEDLQEIPSEPKMDTPYKQLASSITTNNKRRHSDGGSNPPKRVRANSP